MANIQSFLLWLSQFDFSWVAEIDFTQILNSLKAELTTFVNKSLNALSTIFPQLFSMTASVISIVANFFIAVIVSIYLLVSKEDLCRQVKKLTYAFLPRSWADECVEIARLSSQCFTNFVTGQLMEACILGLLCFVGMTIFRFEYAFLISMMVGVSAIIPVVGDFIGTVPGVLLLLFVEPMQAIWFVVFIVVLQQIEGSLKINTLSIKLYQICLKEVCSLEIQSESFKKADLSQFITNVIRRLYQSVVHIT